MKITELERAHGDLMAWSGKGSLLTLVLAHEAAVRADQREKDAARAQKIDHVKAPGIGLVIAALIRSDSDRLQDIDINKVLSGPDVIMSSQEAMKISELVLAELRATAAQAELAAAEYRSDRATAFEAYRLTELVALVGQAEKYAADYAAVVAWAEQQGGPDGYAD